MFIFTRTELLSVSRQILVFIGFIVYATLLTANDSPSLQALSTSAVQNGWKAFEEDKNPDEALIHFNHAILLDERSGKAYFAAGYVNQAKGEFDTAFDFYSQSLKYQPDYPSTHMNMGLIMLRKGKMDESLRLFERARSLAPGNGKIYANLAMWYYMNKRYAEAWNAVKDARSRQGSVNPRLLEALKEKLPEPEPGSAGG